MQTRNEILKALQRDKVLYIMVLLAIIHAFIFRYIPMGGLVIAFKRYTISSGLFGGDFVGLRYFKQFINAPDFWAVLKNTLLLNLYGLIFSFPAPIILALSLNEVRNNKFKRVTQTVSYLPHFISTVIVVGMMIQFLSPSTGLINAILKQFGFEPVYFMIKPEWFRTLYISSGIWQGMGWGSILYLAALSGIDQQLYEAARMDGAGRWRLMWNITLPGILSTIIILFLMRIGHILNVGFEKVMLMQGNSAITYATSDVLSTYIYRNGIINRQQSFATAVGLFDSLMGMILLVSANYISKKTTEISLW